MSLLQLWHLPILLQQRQGLLISVPVNTAADLPVPVDTAALSSASSAAAEFSAAAEDAPVVASVGNEGVRF